MNPGSRVKHWFAGTGTIKWVAKLTAMVHWDNSGSGIAYVADLRRP